MEVTRQNRMMVPTLEVAMDFNKLSADVCNFIFEVHKENGQDNPPGTLYDLVASLSSCIACELLDLNMNLLGDTFKCVKNTLDTTMVDRAAQGLGVPKMKDYITEEIEEKLWKMGI